MSSLAFSAVLTLGLVLFSWLAAVAARLHFPCRPSGPCPPAATGTMGLLGGHQDNPG